MLKLLRIVKVGFTENMHTSPHVMDASDNKLEQITASDYMEKETVVVLTETLLFQPRRCSDQRPLHLSRSWFIPTRFAGLVLRALRFVLLQRLHLTRRVSSDSIYYFRVSGQICTQEMCHVHPSVSSCVQRSAIRMLICMVGRNSQSDRCRTRQEAQA
jgi:hypothetical protein